MMMLYTSDEEFAKDDNNDTPHFDLGLFDDAAAMVYDEGGFDAAQLTDPRAQKVIEETARIINRAIDTAVPHEVPETLRYALENNGFIFSGLKAFHALREVGLSMLDDKGNVKPFEDFRKDVQQINQNYNVNWLNAEYKHALGSSLMAVKWDDLKQDTDRYFLQYRTAQDSRVRPVHAALDGITLPADDPFWSKYYPPNGWGCRCQAVQVRRSKYQPSDPKEAMKLGDEATATNKQQMFRYNAGTEMALFPPKHPYYKAPAKAKTAAMGFIPQSFEAKNIAEAEEEFRKKLGVNCSLKGFRKKDLKQVEDIFKCVDCHFQQFPELRDKIKFVGSISGRTDMLADALIKEHEQRAGHELSDLTKANYKKMARRYCSGNGCYAYSHAAFAQYNLNGVAFNTTWAGEKIENSLKSDVKSKWHPIACDTVKAVFDHELGHKIDEMLNLYTDTDFLKIYDEAKAKGAEYIQDNLSRYAYNTYSMRKSNYTPQKEFIAEAWSEYLNNEAARPIAQAVGVLIKQKYAKLKK
ncbi:phage minor head protein [Prevotella merdae]|uniref:phage minor head protein n=1 Tax=Prevotella merdae TaxID=2079531 RepID=UPI0035679CC1